jgi:hypothetical protein
MNRLVPELVRTEGAARSRAAVVLGGISGFGGALLVSVGALLSAGPPGIVGMVLVAACELALVILLAQVSRVAAGLTVLVLGGTVALAASELLGGWFLVPVYLVIAMFCWIVVAPVVAIVVARSALVPMPPAVALAAVTTLLLVTSPMGYRPDHPVAVTITGAYVLSWGWLGAAMLKQGVSSAVSGAR